MNDADARSALVIGTWSFVGHWSLAIPKLTLVPAVGYIVCRMSTPPTDLPPAAHYNSRLGIVLFVIYLLIYAGFVALSAFAPGVMAKAVIGGVNLAIVYGFGLIVLAFVLAMLYMAMCRRERSDERANEG